MRSIKHINRGVTFFLASSCRCRTANTMSTVERWGSNKATLFLRQMPSCSQNQTGDNTSSLSFLFLRFLVYRERCRCASQAGVKCVGARKQEPIHTANRLFYILKCCHPPNDFVCPTPLCVRPSVYGQLGRGLFEPSVGPLPKFSLYS